MREKNERDHEREMRSIRARENITARENDMKTMSMKERRIETEIA